MSGNVLLETQDCHTSKKSVSAEATTPSVKCVQIDVGKGAITAMDHERTSLQTLLDDDIQMILYRV
jgi:hypothetical protein